jgi:hypothetical protein
MEFIQSRSSPCSQWPSNLVGSGGGGGYAPTPRSRFAFAGGATSVDQLGAGAYTRPLFGST